MQFYNPTSTKIKTRMTTLDLRQLISRSPSRLAFLLIPLALACFALAPAARAVCQEGCDINNNTFLGESALVNNTTGTENTAIGFDALFSNTTGNFNTAYGVAALSQNVTGTENTAIGVNALNDNNNGADNTAIGVAALLNNTTGSFNTANGWDALFNNTTGSGNTAAGADALFNDIGNNNTANGVSALFSNTTGTNNTANGFDALLNNTGSNNIALGSSAGINLTTGSNNIDVGNNGVAGESKTIRIGIAGTQRKTFIAGISGATVASGVGVIVGPNGQLGTVVSSESFKDAIKPMDKASEAILALRPVTFHYKKELDPEGIPQFGLVAEQVEKVNPDLVARDADGKAYTVRYEAVNAMLLNEFLKEHHQVQEQGRKLEAQDRKVQQQEETIAKQQQQLDALTAGLQKVSAQLELDKVAPQMVKNND